MLDLVLVLFLVLILILVIVMVMVPVPVLVPVLLLVLTRSPVLLCSCRLAVQNGLLLVIMLIYNHSSLAEQLVAVNVGATLRKCLVLPRPENMLAIIALSHISKVHKLEGKGRSHDHTCCCCCCW